VLGRIAIFCIACFISVTPVIAQNLTSTSDQIKISAVTYDIRSGLISNNITNGVVDEFDGLWLVSDFGLTFFDGKHSINYSPSDSLFFIRDQRISDLVIKNDELYVAHGKGVDIISTTSKKSRPFKSGDEFSSIQEMIVTSKGDVFAISQFGILYNLSEGTQQEIPIDGRQFFLTEIDNNRLLITNNLRTYVLFDAVNFNIIKLFDVDRAFDEYSFGIKHSEEIGTVNFLSSGMVWVDVESEKEYIGSFKTPNIKFIHPISDSQFLVLRDQNNLSLYTAGGEVIDLDLGLPQNLHINELLVTKQGTIIILYSKGILAFSMPMSFINVINESITQSNGENITRRAIIELPDESLIMTSYQALQQYNPKTKVATVIDRRNLLVVDGYYDNGSLVLGTDGKGLIYYDLKTKNIDTKRFLPNSESEHIYSVYKNHVGNVMLGFGINPPNVKSPYLMEFNPNTNSRRPIILFDKTVPEYNRVVNKISQDVRKHYWICTNAGLYELDQNFKVLNRYHKDAPDSYKKVNSDRFNMVNHDTDSTLWAATNSGIVRIHTIKNQIIDGSSTAPILSGKRITTILDDSKNNLWIATFRGLSHYNTQSGKTLRFYQEDGFPEDEYNYYSYLKSSSNLFYLGGATGVVEFDPAKFNEDLSESELRVAYVVKENRDGKFLIDLSDPLFKNITLTSNFDILNIHFSFSEYINPSYSNYYYTLDINSNEWIEEPGGVVRLWNLPDGDFQIYLKGVDPNGREIIKPLGFKVTVKQPFYMSTLFRFLLIMTGIVIVAVFVLFRYLQTQEIRKIRSNLLNDIHDELGSVLTKTAMKAEVMSSKYEPLNEDLLLIQRYCREGVQSLRNLLWSISSDTYSTVDFQDRVSEWLNFYFYDTPFEFSFTNHIPEENFTMSIFSRRQILSIVKELATNTLKHSNGDHFYLTLDKKGHKYQLMVFDNGTSEKQTVEFSGYGLKSIQARVNQLKGELTFDIQSNGFKTEIIF